MLHEHATRKSKKNMQVALIKATGQQMVTKFILKHRN